MYQNHSQYPPTEHNQCIPIDSAVFPSLSLSLLETLVVDFTCCFSLQMSKQPEVRTTAKLLLSELKRRLIMATALAPRYRVLLNPNQVLTAKSTTMKQVCVLICNSFNCVTRLTCSPMDSLYSLSLNLSYTDQPVRGHKI